MAGHGHVDGNGSNKKVALLIAVLALVLALCETLGKSAQTEALSQNIEASNLWNFFQAKTVRQTVLRAATEAVAAQGDGTVPPPLAQQRQAWLDTIARWESEPSTNEGRRELTARARATEAKRDLALARYKHYEVGSAAFQIAIVLASATVITGATVLLWLAGGLGVVGLAFTAIGLFAPLAVRLF